MFARRSQAGLRGDSAGDCHLVAAHRVVRPTRPLTARPRYTLALPWDVGCGMQSNSTFRHQGAAGAADEIDILYGFTQ